jgi:hypothetical protein
MLAYDAAFNPLAPVADVTVVHPTTSVNSGALRGKLDRGADVTVIPQRLVAELGMTSRGRITEPLRRDESVQWLNGMISVPRRNND